eukprot:TRINITY_DN5892_c0_g1_i1.p1 TRINITY_DN5892_c0_g1~~TRINITY_DN5892_c0_g1_i1.p1  ORF type:complete len:331 (-),score=37.90 TRINITY_DN5892_c0_g1_i1:319-1311(-)
MGSGSTFKATSPEVYRTAGLLAVVSAFLLVEGVVRTDILVGTPDDMWNGDAQNFPPAAMIVGSATEVFFAVVGLAVALAQIVLNAGSPAATIFAIGSSCLGWYTFVVFTIAAPAYNQANALAPLWSGLNSSQSEAVTAMGILGGVSHCFCLQGGQFFLLFKLLRLQNGNEKHYDAEYHRSRLVAFSTFVLIAGGSQLTTGVIVRHALGGGRYAAPVVSPPYGVFYPEMTIACGCAVLLYGIFLILVALALVPKSTFTPTLIALCGLGTYITQLTLQNIAQEWAGGALIILGSQQVGLTFMVAFFPAYLAINLTTEVYEGVMPAEESPLGP